ncbi:MAG: PGDYG domain-containing protein [Planctomycetes bacterium]|nr:PGDYG domain-containing protein [Planctomycetota bacterium]
MKRWQLLLALVAPVMLGLVSNVRAEIIGMSIDGARPEPGYEVTLFEVDGVWHIGTPDYPEYEWQTSEGSIVLEGALDPDPSITFSLTTTDLGAPSSFGFTFILPLAPVFPNPSTVLDSLSGSVTNGPPPGGPGVTVTALAPPAGIPVDGDGVAELQVYTLSDDGGMTWKNVGLDAGPTTFVPLAPFASGDYGAYNQGPIPTIAGGPWTHMRVDLTFGLSGGGDVFTLNGAKVLVPEPGTFALGLLLIGALIGFSRRQSRR